MASDRGMIEGATSKLYRHQAERLKALAHTAATPVVRLGLLEIAAQFEKLAEFSVAVAANSNTAAARDSKSA
jgi:hypothetical protein